MARARCLGVSSTIIATAILLCATSTAKAQTALYCAGVFTEFSSCMTFVGGLYSEPWKQRCDSVKTLNAMARRDEGGPDMIRKCIEDLSYWTNVSFNASRIQDLPTKCQLHLSFPISNSMDCFKAH